MSRRDDLEASLLSKKISPAIVERVLRLSAPYEEGVILRGIHYSWSDDPRFMSDCATKGDVIRRYGREVWERIPRSRVLKRGRRRYASRQEVMRAMQ